MKQFRVNFWIFRTTKTFLQLFYWVFFSISFSIKAEFLIENLIETSKFVVTDNYAFENRSKAENRRVLLSKSRQYIVKRSKDRIVFENDVRLLKFELRLGLNKVCSSFCGFRSLKFFLQVSMSTTGQSSGFCHFIATFIETLMEENKPLVLENIVREKNQDETNFKELFDFWYHLSFDATNSSKIFLEWFAKGQNSQFWLCSKKSSL